MIDDIWMLAKYAIAAFVAGYTACIGFDLAGGLGLLNINVYVQE